MSYLTDNDRPGQHAPSWYAETAGPLPDFDPLDGPARADVCVIGGGYAGLSAALHLAERGVSVILLEANRVGWGASGRNGGQLGLGPRAEIEKYERAVGRADARKVWDIGVAANTLVRDLIKTHGIACDLQDGYLECGWKPGYLDEARRHIVHMAKYYDLHATRAVDADEMAQMLGTTRYHGGFLNNQCGHLHPLKYAIGLARAADAAGAVLHEHTKVQRLSPGRIETDRGVVEAPEILLCCNGYLDGLDARAQAQMLPLHNYIIATEPLGEDRARKVNRDNVCVCDTRFVLNYFRLSPDGRMLWGGGESVGRKFPADIRALVRKEMLKIYPDLADVEITHAWGGTLAITGTRFALFQDLGQGIRSIGGWSGSGVHMATMGGRIAADALAGNVADWDLLARMPTPRFPGGDWFRMPLLKAAMFWYGLRDRI